MKKMILIFFITKCLLSAQTNNIIELISDSDYLLYNAESMMLNLYLYPPDRLNQLPVNTVFIMQTGDNNLSLIKQTGLNHYTNTVQEGNNNNYESVTEGYNIMLQSQQVGDNNSLIQKISGDNLEYFIQQNGSENQIIQIESGVNSIPYTILQKGSGLELIILNSK